jgi:hypothetical protein
MSVKRVQNKSSPDAAKRKIDEDEVVADKHLEKMNESGSFHIPLALFEGHYFHIKKTDINHYAIDNHASISHFPKWWCITKMRPAKKVGYGAHFRPEQGLTTEKLLLKLINTPGIVNPMTPSTPNIGQCRFWEKLVARDDADITDLGFTRTQLVTRPHVGTNEAKG